MKQISTSLSLHLVIHGRVQGVFYRDTMRRMALSLGIAGWVRNLPDGTVESVVQGDAPAVDAIVQWAHRGPVHAQLSRVGVSPAGGNYSAFEFAE